MSEFAVSLEHVSKMYRVYARPSDKLLELLTLNRIERHRGFWALRDIDLEVERGTTLGIIGQNGSGKSTLLQIIAGIRRQTRGDVRVNGKVSALLELGSGFNPEFTGRENVFMAGAIAGLTRRRIEERFDDIARFAEIGDFIDRPVKTYSSGMFMRLAFAVAISVDPEILLVDEALSVGDLVFQHRCMHKINQLRAAGTTVLFVSHDLGAITKFCDRAILLDGGRLIEDGRPDLVVQKYTALVFERERRYKQTYGIGFHEDTPQPVPPETAIAAVRGIPNIDHRFGSGRAEIIGIELLDEDGRPTRELQARRRATVRISARFKAAVEKPIIGFTLRDRLGVQITATNSSYEGKPVPGMRSGEILTADFSIRLPDLAAGSYSISPAVAEGSVLDHDICDWIDNALAFYLYNPRLVYGAIKLEVEVRYALERGAAEGAGSQEPGARISS